MFSKKGENCVSKDTYTGKIRYYRCTRFFFVKLLYNIKRECLSKTEKESVPETIEGVFPARGGIVRT